MKYRRALLLVEPGKEESARTAMRVLRRVAPALERLLIVALAPSKSFAWLSSGRPPERDEPVAHLLAALREETARTAPKVEVQVAPELEGDALAALCAAQEIESLVFGSRSVLSASLLSVHRRRLEAAVLWTEGGSAESGALSQLGVVALDGRARATIAAFLRDHTDRNTHVTWLAQAPPPRDALANFLPIAGIEAHVEVSSPRDMASTGAWLSEWMRDRPIDLLVFAGMPSALLLGALRSVPVLLLPAPARSFGQRAIDVADLIDAGGPLRLRIDQVAAVGSQMPVPDQRFGFVAGGRLVASVTTSSGEAELPAGLCARWLGVSRLGDAGPVDPVAALEQRISVIRPGERPLFLLDAELPHSTLRALSSASGWDCLAVRLRPTRSCHAIRARLREAGLAARVVDARVVLDEGEALDVASAHDAVRLARVGGRLQSAGFPVKAIVHSAPIEPSVVGFVALKGSALEAPDALTRALAEIEASTTSPTAAGPIAGNRIVLELNNKTARSYLLETIRQSQQTLHLQVYMAADDEIGAAVESALTEAAARGVSVSVLVDSLHGLHGSFGAKNPLLSRLASRPGVELRVSRPIVELPSLTDLKQRDHAKLVIADGRVALVGGRNLAHEYYTDFDEVALEETSTWREVPWLDAGARIEGPAVSALSSAFLQAWTEAGGQSFEVHVPPAVGASMARVVTHRGLRDAHTLEMYVSLIAAARSHVYVVNGFPLVLELQHALLRALQRGVRVRALTGHVAPTHAGQPFSGQFRATRTAATEFVHSRLDPIVAAGGDVYLFAQQGKAAWQPDLGTVHPHVHAKLLSVDGERCAVGSANLDVTAAYWESELMLLVEDAALTSAFEAQIERLLASSTRVNREDVAWQRLSKRRAWMRHWPGLLAF